MRMTALAAAAAAVLAACKDAGSTGSARNVEKSAAEGSSGFCGDGVCDICESCSSCPNDCGECAAYTSDADCVPDGFCHPASCVPAAQAPTSCYGACDADCLDYTLDVGHCECQSGACVAVVDSSC